MNARQQAVNSRQQAALPPVVAPCTRALPPPLRGQHPCACMLCEVQCL